MNVYISVIVKTVIQFLKLLCLDSTEENWNLTELFQSSYSGQSEKESNKIGGGKAGGRVAYQS